MSRKEMKMSKFVDQTTSMPQDDWDNAAATFDALQDAVNGDTSSLTNEQVGDKITADLNTPTTYTSEVGASNLDNLVDDDGDVDNAGEVANQDQIQKAKDIETLKVDGKEVEWDFSDREKLKVEIQKGLSAQRKLQVAKEIRLENKRLKAQVAHAADLAPLKTAQALIKQGHTDQAIRNILGEENWNRMLEQKVEEELEYRSADPVRRAELDAQRTEQRRKIQEDAQLQRIKDLEKKIEQREEDAIQREFQTILETAVNKYDLRRWEKDEEVAEGLNESLSLAANAEILREQQRRERLRDLGKPVKDIGAKEINQIYHKHTKRLLTRIKRASSDANEQIEEQASRATQQAQAASTRNYNTSNIISDIMSKGSGSMSDLLEQMSRVRAR
jgi:hypothetical protein